MKIYVSRYSNPELKKGIYTAVRISIGTPRWQLGYKLAGAIKDLMPFGLFKDPRYNDYETFKPAYFARLDKVGLQNIAKQIKDLSEDGKDVVLLCYEDIRKGPDNWCHRTVFAEWWKARTGEEIEELYDPTGEKKAQAKKEKVQPDITLQMSMF